MRLTRLVQTLWWRHAGLDGQAADVLPALLQQGDEVVDGQHDVSDELILRHLDVANCDTHAQHLLQLKLDSGLDLGDLGVEVFSVGDGGWELSGFRETWTQETRDLLDQSVGGDERIVLAGQLLDELLVLVQLLQVVGAHGIDAVVLGTIDIVLVTEDADGHVRARDARELDGAAETLVTLRVIVLEADLELDGLEEVALLLLLGVLKERLDVRT